MRGDCATCTKPIAKGEGIFCANFSARRAGWSSYRKAWCGECYATPSSSPFLIGQPEDDEGHDQTLAGDEKRFRVGHMGDNLMCPFQ
jgi:hypothetical protein